MSADPSRGTGSGLAVRLVDGLEDLGRRTVAGAAEVGWAAALFAESLYWLVAGPRQRQPVRVPSIFAEMMEVGIKALPIVSILAATIGVRERWRT